MNKKSFREKLRDDIVLLDGAFGTYAQLLGLKDEFFKDKPGCMEYLSIASPDFITKIHNAYLESGSDAIETNTFGGNSIKLAEYGLADNVYETNLASTKLARSAADNFSTAEFPRYVIGSMGPTGKLPSSTDSDLGNITYQELKKAFYEQALGIIDGGADALLIETGQDLLEMKAAVTGAKKAAGEKKKDIVLMAQCTLANNGRMLLGTEVSAVMATLGYLDVDVIGLNCSTGPVEMEREISILSENCNAFVSVVPNAGLPVEINGETVYPLPPAEMAEILGNFIKKYRIDVIGGCCGTNPEHIRELKKILNKNKKSKGSEKHYCASFFKGLDLDGMKRPVVVGERINTQGSKKMKTLLIDENYDNIIELGKQQQREGAEILDVCTVLTERSTEKKDAIIITKQLAESVQAPLMIDSTDVGVIEAVLQNYPGTAFINSVNLEDGGEKARKVYSLAKKHGSFVVSLVIDEKGMGKTVERKFEIAKRLYVIATEEYGLEPHRLLFDMLTFTLGTGEKEYETAAIDTFEGIRLLKEQYPGVLTVLGVSNISFGLSRNAREVINMVFLHHAVKSGLDMAIINPAGYIKYSAISGKDCKFAEDLIFNKHPKALNKLTEYFFERDSRLRGNDKEAMSSSGEAMSSSGEAMSSSGLTGGSNLSIEEKLRKCIFDRDKVNIISLVDEAREKLPPEEIINNILMNAMKEVGEKLDTGEMVLPYVLQSAEVMRKAIEYLEQFLSHDAIGKKGKVLLATVFGDVHDIGKNLVKIVLQNNGFFVIDLGKQVPVEEIVKEAKKNKVDAVGLSALLVSTARHMKTCIQSMHEAGLDYPVIIGGAPTNKRFAGEISILKNGTKYNGGVFYAKDAFTGLSIMRTLMEEGAGCKLQAAGDRQDASHPTEADPSLADKSRVTSDERRATVLAPPFYGPRFIGNIPIDEVFSYLDKDILYKLSWGIKVKDENEKKRLIEEEYRPLLEDLKEETIRKGWLDLKIVYGYFKCRILNEDMEILDEKGEVFETIRFKRSEDSGRSLIDYYLNEPKGYNIVAFQAVTVGEKIGEAIKNYNNKKEVTRAFLLHGFSVQLAEALAAYTHDRIRQELKLKKDQGKRYSPGYPLWRQIEDQKKLFNILDIENRLNVKLTEGYQMVPEASTTAMIVFNEKAEY